MQINRADGPINCCLTWTRSTGTLNYAIDPPTHQAMATRAGHEVIDPSMP